MESPAYLILGATHSGRRAAVFDLIKDLASESDPFEVVISKLEPPTQTTRGSRPCRGLI